MMKKRTIIEFLIVGFVIMALYRYRWRFFEWILRLPPRRYDVTTDTYVAVPLRDGVQLQADHFRPVVKGDFPSILIRTPYGRPSELGIWGIGQQVLYTFLAGQGYHIIVQGVRGRFQSEGIFEPFVNEAADGFDTIEWLARRPWFNGVLGLWGISYLGYAQWAAAIRDLPHIKAIMPIAASSRLSRVFYTNGVFTLDGALRWIYLIHVMEGISKRFDISALLQLLPGRRERVVGAGLAHLPLNEVDTITVGKTVGFYQKWLEYHETGDEYWRHIDHHTQITKITVPVHLYAGWYDIFLQEQLVDYTALLAAGRTPFLTIGPEYHLDIALIVASFRESLAWFAAHLKNDLQHLRKRPVRIYVMGAHEWHEMDYWPPPSQITRYFLHTQSLLNTTAPIVDEPVDRYRYIPADPTPIIGGPLLNFTGGSHDQREIEARSDVLLYTTHPLDQDVDVIGPVRLELYVRSSLAHTDFVGRLCDVYPDGRSMNICDGILRVHPGVGDIQSDGSVRIEIEMWATAQRFCKGHRIRLQVCSGGYPRWARNLGVDAPIGSGTVLKSSEQIIYHDLTHPSALMLPVVTTAHRGQS